MLREFLHNYLSIGRVFIFLSSILMEPVFCQQSNHAVRGKVVDAATNQVLTFATVVVKDSKIGTSTNDNGAFLISLPKAGATLLVSYAGYKTEEVKIGESDSVIVVQLTPVDYLLQEVSVYRERMNSQEISSAEIKSEEVRDLAGMTKDPLRVAQLLPGVSVDNETSNKINVRGGTSDENLILINGVEVYNPDHLKELANANISIFNIDMVKSIDFSAGGFSVKYGDALSSMMKIDYREGNRDSYKGKVDLSLIDLSALVEGPINHNGSFIIGVRQSYLDYLMRVVNVPSSISMGYYDIQGQVNYDLSGQNKLRVDVIVSKDNGTQAPSNRFSQVGYYWNYDGTQTVVSQTTRDNYSAYANYANSLVSVMSNNVVSDNLASQTIISYYNEVEHERSIRNDSVNFKYYGFPELWSQYSDTKNLIDNLSIRTFSLNQDLTFQATQFLGFDAGINLRKILYDDVPSMHSVEMLVTNVTQFPDTTMFVYPPDPTYNDTVVTNASTYSLAGHLEQTMQLGNDLILNAGIRLDYFDMNKETRYAPRASLSYSGPFGITVRAACGIFYEPPTYRQLRSSVASDSNTAFEKATHYILGVEKKIQDGMNLRCEFYYKDYSSLIPTLGLADGELAYGNRKNDAKGYATGMDIFYSAAIGSTDILLSYGYLIAKEKLIDSNEGYYPRYTDQTHTLSLAVNSALGNKWTFDIRCFYGSGYAYTPYLSRYDSTQTMYAWFTGNTNSNHYPAYERVDLKIAKGFSLFDNPLQVYLDIMNLLNRRNVLSYTYTYDESGNPVRKANLLYGLIPTIGVSYSF